MFYNMAIKIKHASLGRGKCSKMYGIGAQEQSGVDYIAETGVKNAHFYIFSMLTVLELIDPRILKIIRTSSIQAPNFTKWISKLKIARLLVNSLFFSRR